MMVWKPECPPSLDVYVKPTTDAHKDTRRAVRAAIIHYTAGRFDGAVDWLTTADDTQVSCHYVLAKDGRITQLCRVGRVAYHAGMKWGRKYNPNTWSIGFELESLPGETAPEFSDQQYRNLAKLISWYTTKHNLVVAEADPEHRSGKGKNWWREQLRTATDKFLLLGHNEVNGGKPDPGASFDWKRLTHLIQQEALCPTNSTSP